VVHSAASADGRMKDSWTATQAAQGRGRCHDRNGSRTGRRFFGQSRSLRVECSSAFNGNAATLTRCCASARDGSSSN
jgi:hypothetical protein